MSYINELTDADITALLARPKTLTEKTRSRIREYEKDGCLRFDVNIDADGAEKFTVFKRASADDPQDFSVGLRVKLEDGSALNLMRCNGRHGYHKNRIENERFLSRHVHIATERYIRSGGDPEGFAKPIEDEYNNPDSALMYLAEKCNIYFEGMVIENIIEEASLNESR